MSQNIGFVKLYRDLHGSFSDDPKRDLSCWLIYVHMLENCSWNDGEFLKKNQIKTSVPELEKELIFIGEQVIRTCLKILITKGFILQQRASKWCNAGHIYTVFVLANGQLTGNQRATNGQLTGITERNETEKDCLKNATNGQLTGNQRATNGSLVEEGKKKEVRRNTNIDTTYLTPTEVGEAASYWNDTLPKHTKNKIDMLLKNEARKKAAKSIIEKFGIETIKQAIDTIKANTFLSGDNERNWKPDFSWLMKIENLQKVIEGKYSYAQTKTITKLEVTDFGI